MKIKHVESDPLAFCLLAYIDDAFGEGVNASLHYIEWDFLQFFTLSYYIHFYSEFY